MDFSFSITEYGAGYDVVGVSQARSWVVEAKLFGFLVFFSYEGAIASWDEEFDQRAEKAPWPDLFVALDGGDAAGYVGGT